VCKVFRNSGALWDSPSRKNYFSAENCLFLACFEYVHRAKFDWYFVTHAAFAQAVIIFRTMAIAPKIGGII
jgi:hypothetical protein